MSIFRSGSFLVYGMRHFTKNGYENMVKSKNYEDINQVDLNGRSFVITGANSGLGLSCSHFLASHGGTVHMVCRNKEKGEEARNAVALQSKNENVFLHLCDVSKPKDIRNFVDGFVSAGHRADVLINNAGVMLENRETTEDGLEATFATNTLPTFFLTVSMLPVLKKSPNPRVIAVSSGGMLTEKLLVREEYEKMNPWSGRTAYARTKRHQIALTERFADKWTQSTGISFYSVHPGWADTPAVRTAMPDFYNSLKNKLRTADQGADCLYWLSVTPNVSTKESGEFFRDREKEIKHFWAAGTKYSDKDVDKLWDWCCESSKWSEDELKDKL